jgi:hypothetical protein
VEIADGHLTVVRAFRRKGETVVETLASGMNAAADPKWKSIAEQITRDQQSDRAHVAGVTFAQDSFIRPLSAPFTSIRKARAVLPSLLDVQLPFPLEQCRYEFVHVHTRPDGLARAVALAVPNDRLEFMLEQLRLTGMDPDVMDQEAVALWRYTKKSMPPVSARPRIILYLGLDRTVAVVGNDQEPSTSFSARTPLHVGLDAVTRDRLILRLRQFLAGALRDTSAPDTAPEFIVSGPLAPVSADQLQQNLEVEPARWRSTPQPETWLAQALAESLINPDEWSVNLRSGSLAHPNAARREQKNQRAAFNALTAAALILIAASVVSVNLVMRRHAGLQSEIQQTAMALTGSAYLPRGQEIFLAEKHIKTSASTFTTFQKFLEPTAYPLFSEILTRSKARGVQLDTLSVQAESILARGAGTDWADAEHITQPLTQRGWDVEIERNDAGKDERVHFTVRAQK